MQVNSFPFAGSALQLLELLTIYRVCWPLGCKIIDAVETWRHIAAERAAVCRRSVLSLMMVFAL